ncbi:hypothetical protein GQ44DRAFT_698762 [Phaeosphaeriaceae sp. PMI808]|nr:hypothetical protein GQ44DRAFT_698762 [Phaeosphaeriaceae sp. PMI808]
MNAKQDILLIHLIVPDWIIPIYYDDYNIFSSPLYDFKKVVHVAGLNRNSVYLNDRISLNPMCGMRRVLRLCSQFQIISHRLPPLMLDLGTYEV